MGKMHSQGRPHSLAYTKRVIERVFQRPFDEVFEEFDETPIGSGAIAQVCRLFAFITFDLIELNRCQGVPSHNEAGSTPTILL
jgi:aarF domain-containing kinase